MANRLNMDLRGKTVILSGEYFEGDEDQRKFKCEDGFGCASFTAGNAIFGYFLSDGEKARVEGYQIERLAESNTPDPKAEGESNANSK